MTEESRSIQCGKCGFILGEPLSLDPKSRQPCPECGSLSRKMFISLSGTLSIYRSLKMKVPSMQKGRRPQYESFVGDDLHRKSGQWRNKIRIIDRKNDQYKEIITDLQTGKIIHHCEEPLSKHRGHGSARQNNGD